MNSGANDGSPGIRETRDAGGIRERPKKGIIFMEIAACGEDLRYEDAILGCVVCFDIDVSKVILKMKVKGLGPC